jgi:hypothetical protein
MIRGMSSDRVPVSLPAEVRQAAQRVAQRGRLVDTWLAEHEAEHGPFDETELQELAAEVGVAYLPPANNRTVA